MTKENADALKVLTETINRLADEAVDQADYDRTRNARIIEVVREYPVYGKIIGYNVDVDGKEYYIKKQEGKGIIAKENDVVKLHIPCNNMTNMYLSYPHDPEDVINKYDIDILHTSESTWYISYLTSYNSGVRTMDMHINTMVTFPATTKQFSSAIIDIPHSLTYEGIESYNTSFSVTAEDGILSSVQEVLYEPTSKVSIKLYNENPDTINPVTKSCTIYLHGIIIPFIY